MDDKPSSTTPATIPVSERIRYRLVSAGCRHHANDNIAAFIQPGELDELQAEVQARMQEVLKTNSPCDHGTK
jgi:GTP cyclohydrolase I